MSFDMSGDPALLRSYLLGELDEDEAGALEIRLLKDDALFELAEAVEGDLLAAFSRGHLAAKDRKKVIRRLAASPRGRARLALAEGLATLVGTIGGVPGTQAQARAPLPFRRPMPMAERPAFRFAAMAAVLVITAGGVWLTLHAPGGTVIRAGRHGALGIVGGVRLALQTAHPGGTVIAAPATRNQAAPPPHRPPLAAFAFELALSTTRSAEQHHSVMTIPAGTQRVEIQLPLNDGVEALFKTYRAAVLDAASGAEVWSRESLTPRAGKDGPMIVLSLPAAKLPEGLYTVDLRGRGEGGELELVGLPPFEVRLISAHR